jgi:AcrR family transcriptional regulator
MARSVRASPNLYKFDQICNGRKVGGRSTSRAAILSAARRAIVERGPGKLTLSAVATAAGVSRPTLYRWFPTKEDLFVAIATDEEEQFDLGLRAVLAAHRSPARQLDAAMRYLVTYLDGLMGPDPIGTDPDFVLRGLALALPDRRASMARLLDGVLRQIPAVRNGALSTDEAVELLLRVAYSHYLIPHPEPEVLLASLRSFVGLPRRSAIRVAG